MPLARLACVLLVLWPMSAFAQLAPPSDQTGTSPASPETSFNVFDPLGSLFSQPPQADAAPSVRIPLRDSQELAMEALARLRADKRFDPRYQHPMVFVSRDGRVAWALAEDCFFIHSYVVARDEKDSDSTHFVRSSTCQPSSRYQVWSVDPTARSDGR